MASPNKRREESLERRGRVFRRSEQLMPEVGVSKNFGRLERDWSAGEWGGRKEARGRMGPHIRGFCKPI